MSSVAENNRIIPAIDKLGKGSKKKKKLVEFSTKSKSNYGYSYFIAPWYVGVMW